VEQKPTWGITREDALELISAQTMLDALQRQSERDSLAQGLYHCATRSFAAERGAVWQLADTQPCE
jgi:hypothetical protein